MARITQAHLAYPTCLAHRALVGPHIQPHYAGAYALTLDMGMPCVVESMAALYAPARCGRPYGGYARVVDRTGPFPSATQICIRVYRGPRKGLQEPQALQNEYGVG